MTRTDKPKRKRLKTPQKLPTKTTGIINGWYYEDGKRRQRVRLR